METLAFLRSYMLGLGGHPSGLQVCRVILRLRAIPQFIRTLVQKYTQTSVLFLMPILRIVPDGEVSRSPRARSANACSNREHHSFQTNNQPPSQHRYPLHRWKASFNAEEKNSQVGLLCQTKQRRMGDRRSSERMSDEMKVSSGC